MDRLAVRSLLVVSWLASPLTSRVTLGSATIRLEETTFASVARKLGDASIMHVGDAGGSRYQACYAANGTAPARYYLESGEMGGGDRVMQVDAVGVDVATAAEDPIIATHCRTLLPGTPPLTTNRGIRLGLTRADVERRVQRRARDSAGVTLHERSDAHGRGALAYDVFSWLRVRYSNGRVAAFSTGVVSSR